MFKELIREASKYTREELGMEPTRSQLVLHDNWRAFQEERELEKAVVGTYDPNTYTANVPKNGSEATVLHELYGHGLMFEHSLLASNQEESHKPHNTPYGVATTYKQEYEGFAVWLENLLCEELNVPKVRSIDDYMKLYEHCKEAEQQLSRPGFLAQMGFPLQYKLEELIPDASYASARGEEFFAIGVESQTTPWARLTGYTGSEVMQGIRKLSINITDPILTADYTTNEQL